MEVVSAEFVRFRIGTSGGLFTRRVTGFRAPKNVEKFMSISATGEFSRSTELQRIKYNNISQTL
jgi:hypothetical protein